jgi:hypothetical protein
MFTTQVVHSASRIKQVLPGAKPKPGAKCLAIERAPQCRIFEKPLEAKDMDAGFLAVWGILGIVNIDSHYFLCVVTEKALAAELQGQPIFEVT